MQAAAAGSNGSKTVGVVMPGGPSWAAAGSPANATATTAKSAAVGSDALRTLV